MRLCGRPWIRSSLLFGVNEGKCNGKDRDNDGEREPEVVSLYPCAERDHDDGEVGWDCNEHYTDRFSFDFEFHPEVGGGI